MVQDEFEDVGTGLDPTGEPLNGERRRAFRSDGAREADEAVSEMLTQHREREKVRSGLDTSKSVSLAAVLERVAEARQHAFLNGMLIGATAACAGLALLGAKRRRHAHGGQTT